jgi:hypothetical protein
MEKQELQEEANAFFLKTVQEEIKIKIAISRFSSPPFNFSLSCGSYKVPRHLIPLSNNPSRKSLSA